METLKVVSTGEEYDDETKEHASGLLGLFQSSGRNAGGELGRWRQEFIDRYGDEP